MKETRLWKGLVVDLTVDNLKKTTMKILDFSRGGSTN